MNSIESISYAISCVSGVYIVLDFFRKMFQPKYQMKYLDLIIGSVFSAVGFFINLLNIPFLNLTYFVAGCFIVECLFYKIQAKTIYQTLIFVICYASCDVITSAVFSFIFYNGTFTSIKTSYTFLLNVIFVQSLMLALYKILIYYLKNFKSNYFHRKDILFLSIFPCFKYCCVFLISLITNHQDKMTSDFVILMMGIISTILNLTALYFFEYVSKSNQLENDLALMQQRTVMQYDYYKDLEVQYNESQKFMHDMKHHLEVINNLYEINYDEGKKYKNQLNEIIANYGLKFRCDSKILNIIINEKIQICSSENIKFTYSIENLNLSFMEDIDITSLFANLLDNAIEACRIIVSDKKYIELRIYKYNRMIIINIINSISIAPRKRNGKYTSSKAGHNAIGLTNVKSIVQKYGGDINIKVEQNEFFVSILIPFQES